ncbi:MAG: response regulator [Desulfobulbus sp.]|nr:MAG: response regulator [Desulfobulbus sp.]
MKKKILVVDDEEIIRTTLELNLLDAGYGVDTAASGEEACALLENGYNLIITDLMMEGVGGLDVLRRVKEIDPGIIVFILTGYGELESAVEALRAGADDYLLKPYNHDELLMRMSRVLEKQDMQATIDLYENILSICSECKKIRDDSDCEQGDGDWISMEKYLGRTTGSSLSHGLCPDCYRRRLNELENFSERTFRNKK